MADEMKSITAKSGECGARSHRDVGERRAEWAEAYTGEPEVTRLTRIRKRILCILPIDIASKCVSVDEKVAVDMHTMKVGTVTVRK